MEFIPELFSFMQPRVKGEDVLLTTSCLTWFEDGPIFILLEDSNFFDIS